MDSVGVFLYFGGDIVVENGSVGYSISHRRPTRVPRSINLFDLVELVCRMLNIDSSKFSIKLCTKYGFMERSCWTEVLIHIEDDGVLEFVMQCPNMQILHLYVETQSINPTVVYNEPDDSYIQHVSDGGHFNQAGYRRIMQYISGAWKWIMGSTFHRRNEYFDTNTADPKTEVASPDQGDANTHVDNIDTEPDTSSDEFDEEPADAEHEDIMHEGTSSRPVRGETSQRQVTPFLSSTHEMPPFFTTVFGEEIPDSIGVPSGRTSYYNTERCELSINMMFKDKQDLIASVKDYSVRIVRREYTVVESTCTLWKI
ncbi:hypothetical protein F511_13944 [Dorcoceras hygrometricum]|uniref:Uncharacterized protein n=1 Tax=Dorcoceras hygrometricum TaxID=472368 RepID=A0A2Z7AXF6_9LAMI|nr:hypothetical protein F511_13944 [Dorcoceras hygrometricum]